MVLISHGLESCWQLRDEEMEELEQMLCNYCELPAAGGVENSYGKVNILLQTYISRGDVDSFSLISDLSYVAQVRNKLLKDVIFIKAMCDNFLLLPLCRMLLELSGHCLKLL